MYLIDRRDFLKTGTAIVASLFLPKSLFAKNPKHSLHFVHADTLNSWSVTDPVAWSLENANEPILERGSERLLTLNPSDGERIVRLVTRRCRLNLLEVHPGRVDAHHWGQQAADLRPFFKSHGLARKEIEVVLRDRKKEVITTQHGDDFLYGDPIASFFDLDRYQSKWRRSYQSKWRRRFEQEGDDWLPAPGTSSGFAWDRIEDNRIPWAALKSVWRRTLPGSCLNCDKPMLLVNFGLRPTGQFNRSPNFVSVCGACRRSFPDETVKDVRAWIVANLDAEVRPGFEMIWGKRVEWDRKS